LCEHVVSVRGIERAHAFDPGIEQGCGFVFRECVHMYARVLPRVYSPEAK